MRKFIFGCRCLKGKKFHHAMEAGGELGVSSHAEKRKAAAKKARTATTTKKERLLSLTETVSPIHKIFA